MLVKGNKIPIKEIVLYGFLPSPIKKLIYRLRGYKIASSASLGLGSVVVGTDVEIGEEVKIGFLTVISGRRIKIHPRVQVGMLTFVSVDQFEVGEGTRINNQVIVGGMASPRSSFRMGANGILMEWSFVNTTEPVEIGNNVGIGGHCLFFTHGMWPNALNGNPYKFGPIQVEDDVWLAWRVSVLPGVRIGRGTIVSSDACVTASLPDGALVGGVPAKVIRENYSFRKIMDDPARIALLVELFSELAQWLEYHGFKVREEATNSGKILTIERADKQHRVVLRFESQSELFDRSHRPADQVIVSLPLISAADRKILKGIDMPWLDLNEGSRSRNTNPICEEVEEYFRRRGVRLLKYGPNSP